MGHKFLYLQTAAVAIGNGVAMELVNADDCSITRVGVQVEGISGDEVTFEVTIDGTNWYAQDLALSSAMETPINVATADGIYVGAVCAVKFRARVSTWAAGTIYVTAVGT